MRVHKLLDKKGHDVYSVSPDTTVYDALKVMSEKKIGVLVVLEKKKMVGIMSERDYARKIILKGKASKDTLVKEIMTSNVLYTSPDVKIKKCLTLMTRNHIRHMPVMEGNELVGILSINDVRKVT